MSDMERGDLVECDKCGKELSRSKMVIDKGIEFPELIKKANDEGRDHLLLCPVCSDADLVDDEDEDELDSQMSNVRNFL